jgi:beta-N-acetylhexosaminidase
MKAIGDGDDRADGAVAALAAGADLLLLPGSEQAQRRARAQLTAALERGVIPAQRVSESAQRVRELGSRTRPPVPASPADTAPGAQAAARALAVEGVAGPLPAPPYVVDAGGVMSSLLEPSAASLLGVLRGRLPGTDGIRVSAPPGGGDSQAGELIRAALAAAAGRPLVVAVADAHRKPWQARLLAGLLAGRPDAITVGTASTHDRALAGPAWIGTRGASRVSLNAAAQLLASGRPC